MSPDRQKSFSLPVTINKKFKNETSYGNLLTPMKHLSHFLFPEAVRLALDSEEAEASLEELLQLLRHDTRVGDWAQFSQAIGERPPFPLCIHEEAAVIIYHARTNAVHDLVMAAGRSSKGIFFEKRAGRASLIFVIGIPHALNNDYLRIMGSIARLCKDDAFLQNLLSLKTTEEFIKLLSQEQP